MSFPVSLNAPVGHDQQAVRDGLLLMVYDELRYLAYNYLRGERANHTLQPTALVHEAYLRLAKLDGMRWQNREHFISTAVTMMRHVLVDYARGHRRNKRGGGAYKVSLAEADRLTNSAAVDLESLNDALQRLAQLHPQKSRIVELRFFGGLTIEETARVLAVSNTTVERDWRFARAWLLKELKDE